MAGNYSNGGVDTFNPAKQYIGVRLQQGIPLLDRDWNELEDTRRYFERMLQQNFIGQGAPDDDGFKINAPKVPAPNTPATSIQFIDILRKDRLTQRLAEGDCGACFWR